MSLLGFFAKLLKVTISFVKSHRLSVRPHGTTRLPLDGFTLNLIFEFFCRQSVETIQILVTYGNSLDASSTTLQTRTTDTHYRHTLQIQTTDTHYRHIPLHFLHNERTPVQISLQYLHWYLESFEMWCWRRIE